MTSIDDMAAEIMEGLEEYADLADAAMKKAVRKTATAVKNEISAKAPVKSGRYKRSWTAKKTKENRLPDHYHNLCHRVLDGYLRQISA